MDLPEPEHPERVIVRLGSLRLGVQAASPVIEMLPRILRKRREDLLERASEPAWSPFTVEVLSYPWHAELDRHSEPCWLRIRQQTAVSEQMSYDGLVVLLHRALGALGCHYVHAGGVVWRGKTRLFVGRQGAGKTTCCLTLVRLGADLLADDHLLLRRRNGATLVSGEDRLLRLTRPTALHFYPDGLPDTPIHPGKIEIVHPPSSAAGLDHPIDEIYLTSVATSFQCLPVSRAQALLALIEQLRYAIRIGHPDDIQSFLNSLGDVAEAAQVFRLQLSPNLAELESWCCGL